MEHWAKKFSKSLTQNKFKTCLDTFGNDFGHFWNFGNFLIFKKIFEDSTLHGTLDIKFFKKFSPKHVQNTFGYFWEHFWAFWNFENFFFESFRKLDPPRNTGQKKVSKNLTQNKFKTRLDTFEMDFGHFWNFANFLIFFLKIFEDSTLHGTLGIKFFKKFSAKHVQNTFGYFWEHFWAFWNFENFLIFKKIFEDSTLHGTLGKKNFREIRHKTSSKHVWILLGTFLGIFGILPFL